MSNIDDTIARYKAVCQEAGRQPSKFMMTVLDAEKKNCLSKKEGDVKEDMVMYLAGNNKLITDARLQDEDTVVLYKFLCNNLYVTTLDLRYNNITDVGAENIAKLIKESAALRSVNLMCNDIEEEGAKHIANALHSNELLCTLKMNGNKIGNKGGMYFAQALQINTTLKFLDLGDTDLKTESVIALATVLNQCHTLKALNVNRPILFSHQEETTVHYANMLKVNLGLEQLDLMKHDIRDFGATRLAENLMDNLSLTYLNLSCNRITRDGARELSKLLKRDTNLKVLDLGFNRLEDDGAIYLADALASYNSRLHTLVVTSNNIHGKGLCALADSMKMNMSLSNIYMWGNVLEESACIAFANLIDTGRLELKNTDVKPYVVDGATKLSELSHGIRTDYYWGPSYGSKPVPELAQFTR